MRIWLDDVRPMPPGWDVRVTTAEQAITALRLGRVSAISLDHDLGEGQKTGYDVACWIEQAAYDDEIGQIEVEIHSDNAVGRKNIAAAIKNAQKFWRQRYAKT